MRSRPQRSFGEGLVQSKLKSKGEWLWDHAEPLVSPPSNTFQLLDINPRNLVVSVI